MMTKRAQGLSFNFIVIIAIALIVMFVVIAIFTSRASEGDQNLRSCEARGGVCVEQRVSPSDQEEGSEYDSSNRLKNPRCPGDSNEATSTPMIGAHCFDNQNERDPYQTCCIRADND